MNARKLRGFTAVSSCSSYVFNINKTNASPLLSYVVRGAEHMFKKKKKNLSPLPYYSETNERTRRKHEKGAAFINRIWPN